MYLITTLLFLLILCIILLLCRKKTNLTCGGAYSNPINDIKTFIYTYKSKHVLIIDVANLYSVYRDEKKIDFHNQKILFKAYLAVIKRHNEIHKKYKCHYVIKNLRLHGKKADALDEDTIKLFQMFCKKNNALISIAQDYTGVKKEIWNNPRYHYIKERDDYLCLWLAKAYKISYMNATIMTNDNFKDFNQFGFIPEFTVTHINEKSIINRKIKPKPNFLGQLRDYKITKIT